MPIQSCSCVNTKMSKQLLLLAPTAVAVFTVGDRVCTRASMKSQIALIALVAFALCGLTCGQEVNVNGEAQLAPTFIIDLDSPAETRWVEVTSTYQGIAQSRTAWRTRDVMINLSRVFEFIVQMLSEE